MKRGLVLLAALCASVPLFPAAATAAPDATDRTLVVFVRNYSRMPAAIERRALDGVARLFKRLGIAVVYTNETAIEPVPRVHLLILDQELPELRNSTVSILGAAPRDGDEIGRLAYVFRQPIEALAAIYFVDPALVAAHTIAHEIGHMLLPRGHADDGLMFARWGAREVRAAAGGRLTFSRSEAALIRAALASESERHLVSR